MAEEKAELYELYHIDKKYITKYFFLSVLESLERNAELRRKNSVWRWRLKPMSSGKEESLWP